jgi:hypothetical protein
MLKETISYNIEHVVDKSFMILKKRRYYDIQIKSNNVNIIINQLKSLQS